MPYGIVRLHTTLGFVPTTWEWLEAVIPGGDFNSGSSVQDVHVDIPPGRSVQRILTDGGIWGTAYAFDVGSLNSRIPMVYEWSIQILGIGGSSGGGMYVERLGVIPAHIWSGTNSLGTSSVAQWGIPPESLTTDVRARMNGGTAGAYVDFSMTLAEQASPGFEFITPVDAWEGEWRIRVLTSGPPL